MEALVEDKGSSFADEGRLAHAICAKKLKSHFYLSTDAEQRDIDSLQGYFCGEMEEHTDSYATIVLEKLREAEAVTSDAQLLIETKLDLRQYIPDAFGTADAIIIADGVMEVIDFKYGKGVKVSAERNPQMMIYALGAYERFSFDYRIDCIRMTIVQPRIDNLSEYEISVAELNQWVDDVLIPKAKEAYEGKGPQKPGEWCQFCKVKNSCRALTDQCIKAVNSNPDPRLISADELANEVLPIVPVIKTWLSGIEEYALGQALSGVRLPGWKVVEGRSIRRIEDQRAASEALTGAGYSETDIYKPKELRSLTDLERLVGKKNFSAICGEYITKPQGKPTLAPESDKRPAMDTIADDFGSIEIE